MKIIKKLTKWLTLAVILGVIFNFAIWFAYTHEIRKMLGVTQEKLKLYGASFTYDDLVFTNFKSWSINAKIENPQLIIKTKSSTSTYRAERLELLVANFTDWMKISLMGELINENNRVKGGNTMFATVFRSPPELDIKLKDDASLLFSIFINTIFDTQDFENLRHLVQQVSYKDNGWVIYDLLNEPRQPYYAVNDSNTFVIDNQSEHLTSRFKIYFAQKMASWFPEYKAHSLPEQRLYEHSASLGIVSTEIEFTLTSSASKKTKERWQKLYGDNYQKNSEVKPAFEETNMDINKLEIATGKFNVQASGSYERQLGNPFPLLDMQLKINNIDELLKNQQITYNNVFVARMQEESNTFKLKEATDEQIHLLGMLIKSYAITPEKEGIIHLHISHKPGKEFTINEKLGLPFFTQFLKIFADNLTLRYPLESNNN